MAGSNSRLITACGLCLTLLGGAVCYGWFTGNTFLVQIDPAATPFGVDLALAFLLAGISLVLGATSNQRPAHALAFGVITVALFAAAKHVANGADLWLDHLFHSHPSAAFADYSSRMPLMTALSMLMAGLAMILLPRRPTPAFVLGMMTAILGMIDLSDHILGINGALQWGNSSATAVHASIGMIVLGVGLTIESTRHNALAGRRRIEPYLVGLVTAAGSAVFWQSLVQQETAQVERLLNATAVGIRSTIADRLSDITSSLEVFAAETDRLRDDGAAWKSNIQIVMANHPSIVALWWLTHDGTSVALEWKQEPGGAHFPTPPDAAERAMLTQSLARRSRRALIGRVGPLAENGAETSIRILAPLRRSSDSDLLIAVVDFTTFALDALTGVQNENAVTILAAGDVLFRNLGTASRDARYSVSGRWLKLPLSGGGEWTIGVGPSAAQIATRSPIPAVALLAGLIISALLVSALHGSELERNRAKDLADALQGLELKARQLRDTERRLRELNEELERRVGERTTQLSKTNAILESENRLRRRAQQRLTSSNQNLRESEAFISHELRQPLAAMRLWADLLDSTAAEQLTDKQRGYLQKVSAEIGRMSDLIENELTLSKTSDADTVAQAVELDGILDELEQTIAPRLDEIAGTLRRAPLPTIRGDPRQMRQLFLNLLDNAIKYRRDNAPLRIEVWAAREHGSEFAQTYGDEYCEILVEDNGCGFATDEAHEIFELFRRVGDNKAVSGTGVGLAVCRRIAERHDGSIFAEAAPRRGTRFHIILPLASPITDLAGAPDRSVESADADHEPAR